MNMQGFILLATLAALVVAGASPANASGKVYRWVDEQGVVHFGDAIPPEYSRQMHEVLDSRGVRTTVHGEPLEPKSPVTDNRDRALLATYTSVGEIKAVRDRRIGYLVSQNQVALDRMQELLVRRTDLANNPDAVNELATVEQRIREYDNEIERRNGEIARIRDQFDNDIERFAELRGPDQPRPE
jgi:hypothetical protein